MLTAKDCLLFLTGNGYGNYIMPHPYYKVDGMWCKFISIHGNYAKVEIADLYHADKCVPAYIAHDESGVFAHGATLHDAHESLMFKIGARDTTPYKDWKLSDVKSKAEMIRAYRVITGACEFGTRHFCESVELPEQATVEQAIEITRGQWNWDAFAKFFKYKK